MCLVSLKRVEKEILSGRHNVPTFATWLFNYFKQMQKQPPEKFCKKAVLKNFAIFTGKHLHWSLFLIRNIAKFFRAPILKNFCERLLLKMFMKPMTMMKLRNIKIVDKGF